MSQAAVVQMPTPEQKEEKRKRDRGTGSVYMRGGTCWIAYYVRGRLVRESAHTTSKMRAEKYLQRRQGEAQVGDVMPEKIRYDRMRDALYKDYETRGHKSLLTRKDGTHYIGAVPALDEFFAEYRADKITAETIKEFIRARQKQGVSNDGINGSLRMLRRMFWLQVQDRRFPRNFVPHFPMLPKGQRRTDFLMRDEYDKQLAELAEELRPLVTVAYNTGARKSELLKLKWTEVDLKAGLVTFLNTKNGDDRTVPLTSEALAALKQLREAHPDSEFVFVRRDGRPIKNFRTAWAGARKRAGLPCEGREKKLFHGLRRGVTTNLAEAHVDEKTAMEFTGHKDIATHRAYRQLMLTNLKNAAKKLEEQTAK